MAGPDKRLSELTEILTLTRASNIHSNNTSGDDKRILFGNLIDQICALIESGDYNSSALETLVSVTAAAKAVEVKNDTTKPVQASAATLGTAGITTANITTENTTTANITTANITTKVAWPGASIVNIKELTGSCGASGETISYPTGFTQANTYVLSAQWDGAGTYYLFESKLNDSITLSISLQSNDIALTNHGSLSRNYKIVLIRLT